MAAGGPATLDARSAGATSTFASVNPTVTPTVGGRHTIFKIAFTSHAALGRHAGDWWLYGYTAVRRGGFPYGGCLGGRGDAIDRGVPGQRLTFTVRWKLDHIYSAGSCVGRYYATIKLVHYRSCPPRVTIPIGCVVAKQRVVGRVNWLVGNHE